MNKNYDQTLSMPFENYRAIRAMSFICGEPIEDLLKVSIQSEYFITCDDNDTLNKIVELANEVIDAMEDYSGPYDRDNDLVINCCKAMLELWNKNRNNALRAKLQLILREGTIMRRSDDDEEDE